MKNALAESGLMETEPMVGIQEDHRPLHISDFTKPIGGHRYHFGTGNKETLLNGLRKIAEKITSGDVLMQGIELVQQAELEAFTVSYLTFRFVEKGPK